MNVSNIIDETKKYSLEIAAYKETQHNPAPAVAGFETNVFCWLLTLIFSQSQRDFFVTQHLAHGGSVDGKGHKKKHLKAMDAAAAAPANLREETQPAIPGSLKQVPLNWSSCCNLQSPVAPPRSNASKPSQTD